MLPRDDDFDFVAPPEAPVFEPDEDEWKDPLGYIAKIHPYAVKVGICKIRPPPHWQPTFSVDVDKFRFVPRIQKLNELEATTRAKLNFIDAIAKFWELQGSSIKLPNVEKRPLDVYQLHKIVKSEGGYEDVTRLRRWSRVALLMGLSSAQASAVLRRHYEKILYPYDVFMSGAMTGDAEIHYKSERSTKLKPDDPVYVLDDTEGDDDDGYEDISGKLSSPSSNIKSSRRSRYRADEIDDKEENVDYSNPALKKLQFLAPGPKITGNKPPSRLKHYAGKYSQEDYITESDIKPIDGLTRRKQRKIDKTDGNIFDVVASWVDDYQCLVCENGDDEDSMLLCDSCDSSYHMFCLIPPLTTIPPGDWRCPKCLAKECKKPLESFGFEQAKKLYSLEEFGAMADKFKEEYFSMPPHEVPTEVIEREFWRLVSSVEDDVAVEYGADLHSADHGSGFPMRTNTDDPDDEEYIVSPWNLNNLSTDEKSVLKHINQDISGMKVPWIYIGMCFSSFCWHTEDHWSYSINYLHWGEPKTWYGVPESEAEKLELCVKSVAPELFEHNPDLLHHLVTLCTPTTLMDHGVPIVRTNQQAGEFVVTFPRAYHAGFNQGYNCAEAVNFCPADWLSTGKLCIEHYRKLRRTLVFSHEELVCKMASVPETLDLDLAKKLYVNMKDLVQNEIVLRKTLHKKGIADRQRVTYELIPDDERQCNFCKTTVFFSSVSCSCNTKILVCLHHADEICVCQNMKKIIKYRYNLEELPDMLNKLKKRADSFDNWEREVQKALSCSADDRLELSAFKSLIHEAGVSNFPNCELLEQIKSAVAEAEQCSQVAIQLLTKKHKTRKTSTSNSQSVPRLSLEELKDYASQVQNLPCVIKETAAIDKLMEQVESFRFEAKLMLTSDDYNEQKDVELLDHADALDIDLPEINELRLDLKAAKWLQRIEEVLNQDHPISLDVIRGCVDQGIGLRKKQASERPLFRLKELLYAADRWEEKAKLCLQAKPRHMVGTLEVIVQEASKVKIILPNVSALKEALFNAKEWSVKVEKLQNDDYYPYYDILESLVAEGRPVPVRLEQLPQMESQVAATKAWKERAARTFLKKGSSKMLLDILQPRKDVGIFDKYQRKKKYSNDKGVIKIKEEGVDPTVKVKESDDQQNSKEQVSSTDGKKDKTKELKTEQLSTTTAASSVPSLDSKSDDVASLLDPFNEPDPLNVTKMLKHYEEVERESIKKLQETNIKKLYDENADGPYCVCRRQIEGFMIRCVLCLEWYHTSCIVVPKTVSGKPIGKGYTSWSATREVKYLCTLCCRSRRPRLDTILSLLMSLQKLPVRVAEGEALQFLTERAMNWQERVKQSLTDIRIQCVINEIKNEIERCDKPTNSHFNLLIQKLLDVRIRNVETVKKHDKTNFDNNADNKPTKDSELECKEEMEGSPVSKDNICLTTNPQIHLLQSDNPSRAQSPVDVITLVDTSMPTQLSNVSFGTDISGKSDVKIITMAALPNSLVDELELLAYEGFSLEVGLDEVFILWAILQVQRPLRKEQCMIMNTDYRRKILKDRKKQRSKRKLDIKPVPNVLSTISSSFHQKNTAELVSKSKKVKIEPSNIKKEVPNDPCPEASNDDEQDEEDCSANVCRKPLGEEVEWVQCDSCEKWYHVICVGISAEEAGSLDVYVCPYCKPVSKKTKKENEQSVTAKQPNVADLSVIAEVAHRLIADAESKKDLVQTNKELKNEEKQNKVVVNSLICLADVSETIDTQGKTSSVLLSTDYNKSMTTPNSNRSHFEYSKSVNEISTDNNSLILSKIDANNTTQEIVKTS